MRPPRLAAATLCAMLAVAAAREAHAQSIDAVHEARTRFERGVGLYQQHDYDGALAEFARAYELSHRPEVLFNVAAANEALHRYGDALVALRDYLAASSREAPRADPHRAEAERAIAELEALVAHVRVAVEPAGGELRMDGRVAPASPDEVLVGPGDHVVEASLPGYAPAREEFRIASGESRDVRLALRSLRDEHPAPRLLAGLAITGVPPAATVAIDGRERAASERIELPPGRYAVSVAARGTRPWRGEVVLAAGASRTLRVSLAPARAGALEPRWFLLGATVTGALAVGSATAGLLTMAAHAEFATLTQGDPRVDDVASRGRACAATADALAVAAVASGAVSGYLLSRTEWDRRASRAELAVAPVAGGALAWASARF